jgi:chromatin remodeling complex protein RSC6
VLAKLGVSSQLAAVVGSSPMPRTQVISKLWAYIKRNGLQAAKNSRAIKKEYPDIILMPIIRTTPPSVAL